MSSRTSATNLDSGTTTAGAPLTHGGALAHRMLNEVQVRALTTLSRATRWRMARSGTFPKPIKISTGRIAWREADVLAWLSAKTEVAA